MLSVRNGARAVEFYKAAFGAQVLFRHDEAKAGVVARLSLAKSDFWLADESPEHFNFGPETLGGGTSRMVVIVEDPDAVSEQAVAAGAVVVWPVRINPTVGAWGESWIPSGIIGKSASL